MTGPRFVAVPRLLLVGSGVLGTIERTLADEFNLARVVVVSGGGASRGIAREVTESLARARVPAEHHIVTEGTLTAAAALLERLDHHPATLVCAVGGGRPIDVAKLAATRAKVDVVAVPTVLSHDGMCSPVASLVAVDGVRRSVGASMPAGVVIDIDVVGAAPLRFLQAGVGDLVSNLAAVADWRLAALATAEVVDELAASLGLLAARSALDIDWPPSPEGIEVVARGLLMSGMAMEIAGSSRPCSGAEHLISHALDELPHRPDLLHGEQVALGLLVVLRLHLGVDCERVEGLLRRTGLVQPLIDGRLDPAALVAAVQRAPATRPGRYTILDSTDLGIIPVTKLVESMQRDLA